MNVAFGDEVESVDAALDAFDGVDGEVRRVVFTVADSGVGITAPELGVTVGDEAKRCTFVTAGGAAAGATIGPATIFS